MKWIVVAVAALLAAAVGLLGLLWLVGLGTFGDPLGAGRVEGAALPGEVVAARGERVDGAARSLAVPEPSQILFGDLHVHSSFSLDAFQLALPITGGDGVHPVADACDFARYCANLDFWSINDHASSITPRRWQETIESVRRCDEIAGPSSAPDLVSFLGWEWTQIGSTPQNHYGHKNVILRGLGDAEIPARPIAAKPPPGVPDAFDAGRGGTLALGAAALAIEGGHDVAAFLRELGEVRACPAGVPVRDLPTSCREEVETPGELFARLLDWGVPSLVIPHGTTWGMYTPPGTGWAKQLDPAVHDPSLQRLVEIYSGHGNSEEYRDWRAVRVDEAGGRQCPEATPGYLPACRRAGAIVHERCLDEGAEPGECEARAALARQHFVDADRNGGPWTLPGVTLEEWLDAGQCSDCFQPALNYRPASSVQAMLALSREAEDGEASRFRFGFIASSDNHTARPGTGYKEVARREMTDARMGEIARTPIVQPFRREPEASSQAFDLSEGVPSVAFFEAERGGSFMYTGGLAAVHARGRDRDAVWDALERRETYGTSGPRILLWFDLVDSTGRRLPMGSEVAMRTTPTFEVRAAGSFEQQPGCPDFAREGLSPERLARLCQGECYHPSDERRPITRIEVVRIRPQAEPDDPIGMRIEGPWRVLHCEPSADGCRVSFSDDEFVAAGVDTTYYVRAIESASPVVGGDPLGCERDATGACVSVDPCFDRPDDDDCLAPNEQRAWSSPIYVDTL